MNEQSTVNCACGHAIRPGQDHCPLCGADDLPTIGTRPAGSSDHVVVRPESPRAGPWVWEGRVVLPPDRVSDAGWRPSFLPVVMAATVVSFLWYCHAIVLAWMVGLAWSLLPVALVAALLARFGGVHVVMALLMKFIALVVGALLGAAVTASRPRGEGEAVGLRARMEIAADQQETVSIKGVEEGVRQGDRLRCMGWRRWGVIRPLLVINTTSGRRFLSAGLVHGALLLGAVLMVPLTVRGVC